MERQADMLIKILGYDRTLLQNSFEVVRVGIIYEESNAASISEFQGISDNLFDLMSAGRTVGGKKVTFSGVAFKNSDYFLDTVHNLNVNVLYITSGNDANLAYILRTAQNEGILTFSCVPYYLDRGVASGVEEIDGGLKVVIHLTAAKAQGADFKAELLKISRVIQ